MDSFEEQIYDLTEDLKFKLTCNSCYDVSKTFVLPCNHSFCETCLNKMKNCCAECKQPFSTQDSEEDSFSKGVLEQLQAIRGILTEFSNDVDKKQWKTAELPDELDGYILKLRYEIKRNHKGETPLHIACKKNNVEYVLKIIKNGVDINMKDHAGWTPLHEAVESKSIQCVKSLLEAGALPSIPGEWYITPLHKAALLNNKEIIELLLRHGADPRAVDYSGKTPIDWCPSKETVSILENTTKEFTPTRSLFLYPWPQVYHEEHSEDKFIDVVDVRYKDLTALKKGEVTHYVITKGTEEDPEIDLFHLALSIVQGASVVTEKWLTDYLHTQNDYLGFQYIMKERAGSIKRSVINRIKYNPNLFDGINFFFGVSNKSHNIMNKNFSKDDLITLVTVGGGKILSREPALRTVENQINYPFHADKSSEFAGCCNFIIYDESSPPQLLYNMKELKHRSSVWLMECILNFSIVS